MKLSFSLSLTFQLCYIRALVSSKIRTTLACISFSKDFKYNWMSTFRKFDGLYNNHRSTVLCPVLNQLLDRSLPTKFKWGLFILRYRYIRSTADMTSQQMLHALRRFLIPPLCLSYSSFAFVLNVLDR